MMEMSVEGALKAVEKWKLELASLLPINELVKRLDDRKLLPSAETKSKIDSICRTHGSYSGSSEFLDSLLIPGLKIGYTGYFKEMVNMLKESDFPIIKVLSQKFMAEVSPVPSTDASPTLLTINTGITLSYCYYSVLRQWILNLFLLMNHYCGSCLHDNNVQTSLAGVRAYIYTYT